MLEKILFDHFKSHLDDIPKPYLQGADTPERAIADYIAGMTDRFALHYVSERRKA
jgi:dGTPase